MPSLSKRSGKSLPVKKCRLCGGRKFIKVLSLGNIYINTFGKSVGKSPLELIECKNCSLLQLKHSVDPKILYSNYYWYQSALNPVIVNDLKEIVNVAFSMVRVELGDVFLDIGANDGTLLSFVPHFISRIGVEPAGNFQEKLAKKCNIAIGDFWGGRNRYVFTKKAKIITAIGMFYDLEDPNGFIKQVKENLADDGLFISQLMTIKPMLANNDLGNICHEHLEYYSYKTLKTLFENNGLEIFKVEENKINGGSYRLFARHFENGSINYPEPKFDFKRFEEMIKKNKKDCVAFIKSESQKGKKIYIYGASTKNTTILHYYGLKGKHIAGIAEIHPDKIGENIVGTKIKIYHEDEARKKADYFFVPIYGFRDFILNKEKDFKGKFIFSIPKFEII